MVKAIIEFNVYNSVDNKIYIHKEIFYNRKNSIEFCVKEYLEGFYCDCIDVNFWCDDLIVIYYDKYVLTITYDVQEIVKYNIDNVYTAFKEASKLYIAGNLNTFVYDIEDMKFKCNVSDISSTIIDFTEDIEYIFCNEVEITKKELEKYFE